MNRNNGFLWEDERELIDNENTESPEIAYRVKNGPGNAQGLGKTLEGFRHDLERVEHFWRVVMEEEGGRYQWEDTILPANETQIRRLYTRLGDWLEKAETEFVDHEQEIVNAVVAPLREDVNEEELRERWEALTRLLRNDALREIFIWIGDHPKKKIPSGDEYRYKNITWRQAASSELKTKFGLIENFGEWDHCYQFTSRGKAIFETIQNIESDSRIRKSDLLRWAIRHELVS